MAGTQMIIRVLAEVVEHHLQEALGQVVMAVLALSS